MYGGGSATLLCQLNQNCFTTPQSFACLPAGGGKSHERGEDDENVWKTRARATHHGSEASFHFPTPRTVTAFPRRKNLNAVGGEVAGKRTTVEMCAEGKVVEATAGREHI